MNPAHIVNFSSRTTKILAKHLTICRANFHHALTNEFFLELMVMIYWMLMKTTRLHRQKTLLNDPDIHASITRKNKISI